MTSPPPNPHSDVATIARGRRRRCRLDACPPGLFLFDGHLCFRSEYTTTLENPRRWQVDAYVVESGEYFWGGAKSTKDRGRLMVTPISRRDGLAVKSYLESQAHD